MVLGEQPTCDPKKNQVVLRRGRSWVLAIWAMERAGSNEDQTSHKRRAVCGLWLKRCVFPTSVGHDFWKRILHAALPCF